MTTLHLGVVDVPYTSGPVAARRIVRRVGKRRDETLYEETYDLPASGQATTGDVARWLEDKYHVMESFFETHNQDIADDLAESMKGALETLLMSPLHIETVNPFAAAAQQIENRFRKFLSEGEVEHLGIPGVPTQAALEGRSARFKSGFTKGHKRRPSFIDTGLYEASERVWVD